MVTLLTGMGAHEAPSSRVRDGELWLNEADLLTTTGFAVEDEGFCRGLICVPLPPGRDDDMLEGDEVNLSAFWRHFGGAVRHDAAMDTWVFGEPAADRAASLLSLQAPDFTLPDSAGVPHSLSSYRGQKVLLAAWASW